MKHTVLGILAHVDAGKTTLSENLLFTTGAIRHLGRVDSKNAFLDNNSMERERGITIFSKQACFNYKDLSVTLLDTPGHMDFSAEMERTLQVLDYAVLLISAADLVNGYTRTIWRLLEKYEIPVFIFVNKMDQNRNTRETVLSELQKNLNQMCFDFTERDRISMEDVAMSNDALLNKYLEEEAIYDNEIGKAIFDRQLFPVYFGSALRGEGIEELLEGLSDFVLEKKYSEKFSAVIYKITRGEDKSRLTHMKITGGSLCVKQDFNELGKVNQIRMYSGGKYDTCDTLLAGRVCAVTGFQTTRAGTVIDISGEEILENIPVISPVLSYSITTKERMDINLLLQKLKELEEELPEIHIVYNEELKQINGELMGEVQIEIITRLFKERYGQELVFGQGKIVYKETISNAAIGVGHFEPLRHYAEVQLLLKPLSRGSGLVFETDCSEDILAKNWQRLIMTHLEERTHRGVLTGSPITDMKITIVSGKAHTKHTEGGDFRKATYRAVRNGLMYAENILLEPYYSFVIDIPENSLGRAMTDMEKLFSHIDDHAIENGRAVIWGRGPVKCLSDYQKEITIYTKGSGSINFEFAGYDICHDEETVIEEKQYDPVADIRNTPDSVFCAGGAGYNVPWNEVREYMHTTLYLSEKKNDIINSDFSKTGKSLYETLDLALGTEEIDEILLRANGANKKSSGNRWKLKGNKPRQEYYRPVNQKPADTREKYLLVDGYNVIFAWSELKALAENNIDGARGRLLDILCNYQAIKKVNLIVVFDAYRIKGHDTEFLDYHNIHVVYTKEAETADRYIERFAHDNSKKYEITVATSDGLEQIIIRGEGCILISSREFEKEVMRLSEENMSEYLSKKDNTGVFELGEKIEGLE